MSAYEFQEGQLERIKDIVSMIDSVDKSTSKDPEVSKLLLTLSALGLTVAAAMSLLKRRGILKK